MGGIATIKSIYKPIYTTKKRYIVLTGGRGCFLSEQKICTIEGVKNISEIKENDFVKSYNSDKKVFEYKKVLKVFEFENDKIISIKLKNGSVINVTENHDFFYEGNWVKIVDLLKLWYGRDLETNNKI